jgi:Flp pilus assembly protein TadD
MMSLLRGSLFVIACACMSASTAYEAVRTPTTHYHYDVALAALDEKDYARVIDNLKLVVRDEPRNADAHDWLGFAYGAAGNPKLAMTHVSQAVKLDPSHRRARQHLGELQLAAGDAKRARETLAGLQKLCNSPCEEAIALQRALDAQR